MQIIEAWIKDANGKVFIKIIGFYNNVINIKDKQNKPPLVILEKPDNKT